MKWLRAGNSPACLRAPARRPQLRQPVAAEAVKAVLAGNISRCTLQPGATVDKGDPLLVVEAMKMETAVVAPRAGTVTDVFVAEGDAVAVGDALVAIG